jgi:hypothetical protein
MDVYSRFLTKINKNGTIRRQELGCCWEWVAGLNRDRYGVYLVEGKRTLAHRYSYTYHKGEIPAGLMVRHMCDEPSCVNPDHLLVGTALENARDKVERNRFSNRYWAREHPEKKSWGDLNGARTHPERRPRGNTHGQSKLTEDDIKEIIILRGFDFTQVELAKMYGVRDPAISRILNGERWAHIWNGEKSHRIMAPAHTKSRGEGNGSSKLKEDDVREIRILRDFAFTQRELGKMYNVSISTISGVLKGHTWRHVI